MALYRPDREYHLGGLICRGTGHRPVPRTDYTRKGVTILTKSFLFTVLLGTLALGLLACEIPAESSPAIPAADAVEPTVEVTTVRVTGAVVNLRAGPSVAYAVLGQVQADDSLPVTGINADRTWLQVAPEGEIRWIFADLTDVTAELRGTLAEVADPGLEPAVSSDTGQSESAAAEAAPDPTTPPAEPLAADYIYVAPGSYDWSRFPALDYEWELVFSDNSSQWDWAVSDFPGCYDAVRLFIGETARAKGLTRAEIILSDPFVERDLTSYVAPDFTHRLGVYVPHAKVDDAYLAPRWPDWTAAELPNPDLALVQQECTDWPTKTGVQNGEYTCTLHPMWGNTETEWGRVYLDASANIVMSLVLGSILHGNDHASGRNFMLGSWSNSIYLWPQKNGQPVGHGTCIHLTRT